MLLLLQLFVGALCFSSTTSSVAPAVKTTLVNAVAPVPATRRPASINALPVEHIPGPPIAHLAPIDPAHQLRVDTPFVLSKEIVLHYAETSTYQTEHHYGGTINFTTISPALVMQDHSEVVSFACTWEGMKVVYDSAASFNTALKWKLPLLFVTEGAEGLCAYDTAGKEEYHPMQVDGVYSSDLKSRTIVYDAYRTSWSAVATYHHLTFNRRAAQPMDAAATIASRAKRSIPSVPATLSPRSIPSSPQSPVARSISKKLEKRCKFYDVSCLARAARDALAAKAKALADALAAKARAVADAIAEKAAELARAAKAEAQALAARVAQAAKDLAAKIAKAAKDAAEAVIKAAKEVANAVESAVGPGLPTVSLSLSANYNADTQRASFEKTLYAKKSKKEDNPSYEIKLTCSDCWAKLATDIVLDTGSFIDNSFLKLALLVYHKIAGRAVESVHLALASQSFDIQTNALTQVGSTADHIGALVSDFVNVAAAAQATVKIDPSSVVAVTASLKAALASTNAGIESATVAGQAALTTILNHVTPSTIEQVHAGIVAIQAAGHSALAAIYVPGPDSHSRMIKRGFSIEGLIKSAAKEAFPILGASLAIKFSVEANIDLTLSIEGKFKEEFEQTLFTMGVPGFSIPDIVTIGPEFRLVGSGSFEIKGTLEVTTGADFEWKDVSAKIGFEEGGAKGNIPRPTFNFHKPEFDVKQAEVSVGVYIEPQLILGLDLTLIKKSVSAGLGARVGLVNTFAIALPECSSGLNYELSIDTDVSAIYNKGEGKEDKRIKLYEHDPIQLYDHCFDLSGVLCKSHGIFNGSTLSCTYPRPPSSPSSGSVIAAPPSSSSSSIPASASSMPGSSSSMPASSSAAASTNSSSSFAYPTPPAAGSSNTSSSANRSSSAMSSAATPQTTVFVTSTVVDYVTVNSTVVNYVTVATSTVSVVSTVVSTSVIESDVTTTVRFTATSTVPASSANPTPN